MKNVDLSKIHYLTGPFEIETAEPGDVLIVDIQDVQPMQDHPWGFTGVFAKENGGGFLDEIYPNAWVSSFMTCCRDVWRTQTDTTAEPKPYGISRASTARLAIFQVSNSQALFTLVFSAAHLHQRFSQSGTVAKES